MKLLLTSTGLKNQKIRDFFVSQFNKLASKKACLIFTIREESDWQWFEHYDKELKEIGLQYDGINISEEKDLSDLQEYDIYYVCGGNTFYILDRLRKTNLYKVNLKAIENGKFYVGVSAGSIIAGPDIEAAGIGEGDVNDINLTDLTGFKLVPYLVSPHYTEAEKTDIESFKARRAGEPVIALTDDQALFVDENGTLLIGGNEPPRLLQEKLVPLAQELHADGRISFSSVFAKAEEGGNFWRPIEDIVGDYIYAQYDANPDWVVEMSKKIADDYQLFIEECVKRGVVDGDIVLQDGATWTKESLQKWAEPLLKEGYVDAQLLDKLLHDFETAIAEKGENFFGYAHGNIIGDHVFVGKDETPYLLGMRIVPRPGKGYYDFLRALDWLILKVGQDEGKFEKIVGWMQKYLADYAWEEVKLVFALRCVGIFGWDMLHRGDFGTGDVELKKQMLLKFIKRDY